MSKKTILGAVVLVAITGSFAHALTAPGGGVVGSIHDMTLYGTIATGDPETTNHRVCAYCHTPHHAITTGSDYLPLWSHTLTVLTFTPYKSATIDAIIDPTKMMDGPSKLCMSCHDGTVAVDTHYAFTGSKTLTQSDTLFSDLPRTPSPSIGNGGALNNDHPIGFIYDGLTDGGVATGPATGLQPDSTSFVTGKDPYIRNKTASFLGNPNLKISDRLWLSENQGNKPIMTCATCHDVHNKKNVDASDATNYLLMSSNTNSDLCLSCHIK